MMPALVGTLQIDAAGLHFVLQDDGRAVCVALHLQRRLVWPAALARAVSAAAQAACTHTSACNVAGRTDLQLHLLTRQQ